MCNILQASQVIVRVQLGQDQLFWANVTQMIKVNAPHVMRLFTILFQYQKNNLRQFVTFYFSSLSTRLNVKSYTCNISQKQLLVQIKIKITQINYNVCYQMINDFSNLSEQLSFPSTRKAKFNLIKISKSTSPIHQISSCFNRVNFLQNKISKSNRRIINQHLPVYNGYKNQKNKQNFKKILIDSSFMRHKPQRDLVKQTLSKIKFTRIRDKSVNIVSDKENKSNGSTLVTSNRSSKGCVISSIQRVRSQKKVRHQQIMRQKIINQQKIKAQKQQHRIDALLKRFRVKKSQQIGRISLQNFYSEKNSYIKREKQVYRNTLRQKKWAQVSKMALLFQEQQKQLNRFQQSLLIEDQMKTYIEDTFVDQK